MAGGNEATTTNNNNDDALARTQQLNQVADLLRIVNQSGGGGAGAGAGAGVGNTIHVAPVSAHTIMNIENMNGNPEVERRILEKLDEILQGQAKILEKVRASSSSRR